MRGHIKTVAAGVLSVLLLASCGAGESGSSETAATETAKQEAEVTETVSDAVRPEDVKIDETIRVENYTDFAPANLTFDGWGTSLCWWANRLGYSDSLAQQSADAFYGDDGLRMNIMRYNIGGGDDPDPEHVHITRTDSAVPGWSVYDSETGEITYDYEADARQLNVLKRCYEAAGDEALVEVFSNSPPYYMTVSGCSSGNTKPAQDNLREDQFEAFAEYLTHVTDYIQNELGITVTSLAPMNEPDTNFWGAWSRKQEGCHFDSGESQSKIIELCAKGLAEKGLDNVIVAASDETKCASAMNSYIEYSDKAKEALGRINTHSYDTNGIDALGAFVQERDLKLWMDEVDGSGTAGKGSGEMGSALWLGQKIISDITKLRPSAWVIWQIIDTHISEEGMNGNTDGGMVDVTGGFWGTAVADHDNDQIILTQKYYGFGQFTRYIRPGMELRLIDDNTIAAYSPETGALTIVALNTDSADKTVDFDLSAFGGLSDTVKVIRTSGDTETGEHWAELADIASYGTGFVAELKGFSITTFVIE